MRTFIIRGAMITFFAVTGLFGSAATVQFDGLSASVQTQTTQAAPPVFKVCGGATGIPCIDNPSHPNDRVVPFDRIVP